MNLSFLSLRSEFEKILKIKNMRVILTVGAYALAALILYLPMDSKCRSIERSVSDKEKAIHNIKASGINLLSSDDLARLQKDSLEFKNGFIRVSQVAMVLNSISEVAQASYVKVVSIHSETPKPLDADSAGAETAQGPSRLPIQVVLHGNYKAIGTFLEALTARSTKKFVIDDYSVKKSSVNATALECDLTLSFFLSSS